MPPRTRPRATKVLKENIDVVKKSKVNYEGKTIKSTRKALADKTNSLSDDNTSIDVPTKASKKPFTTKNSKTIRARPRRERCLPPRYVENETLKNLSNSKVPLVKKNSVASKTDIPTEEPLAQDFPAKIAKQRRETNIVPPTKDIKEPRSEKTSKQALITKFITKVETRPKRKCRVQPLVVTSKDCVNVISPFKTPSKDAGNNFIVNRPKRVHRLPSRFEDHNVSPSKFIPVQPCHASTPIIDKKNKILSSNNQNALVMKKNNEMITKNGKVSKASKTIYNTDIDASNCSTDKSITDTNNNGQNNILRPKRTKVINKLQNKQISPDNKIKPFTRRLLDNSLSFRLLENKETNEKEDVYEFTFDPNEEPPPQKKKRKKPVRKRPPKPKIVTFKSNYDDNVSKALAKLKSKVQPSQNKSVQSNVKSKENVRKAIEAQDQVTKLHVNKVENEITTTGTYTSTENRETAVENIQSSLISKQKCDNIPQSNYSANITPALPNDSITSIHPSNYASIRVEDIAADFEFSDHNDINYSPVTSPHHPLNSDQNETNIKDPQTYLNVDPKNKDPLNLQEDESFFEPPIASSSMNTSIRQPQASPWRVEFCALPMRWHNNTYVKPNMTPAVECSFINSEETRKKHIYTNLLSEPEKQPEIFDNPAPAFKQTSIISFIKEVAERNANKKKRRRSQTRDIFEDVDGASNTNQGQKTPKKAKLNKESSNTSNDTSADKENSDTSNKTLSVEKKKKGKDGTFFGFDESEDTEQENISLLKSNPNPKRVLRSRNVLQELNTQPVPTRVMVPVSAKAKLASSEVLQLYDQLKATENAQFPENGGKKLDNTVADADPSWHEDNEDSESVHLFEDIVHHLKPHRKSYGKAKKVTFQHSANSDSDSQPPVQEDDSSSNDDLADLSFHLPTVKKTRNRKSKKKKPKKLLTRQEEKEVEEWAKGFNSMCEDVDEFPLLVE